MNKFKFTIAITTLLLVLIPVKMQAISSGAPTHHSGEPPANATCAECHGNGTVNTGGGKVEIALPGPAYTPGATEKVTVTVTDGTARRWGFQITARLASDPGTEAGTFATTDGNTQLRSEGALQWMTHTSAGTRRGTTGPVTFEFNWTAPATNMGEVIFYAAANAADNDGAPSAGDKIYSTQLHVSAANATPTPTLRADQPVLQTWSANATLSPGSWIELYGANLSAVNRQWADADFSGGNAPTQLDGVGVLIDEVPAFISYVSPTQINAQVPNINTSGSATVVVTGPGGVRSAPVNVPRAAVTPALLTTPAFRANDIQYVVANHPDLTTFVGRPNLVAGAPFRPATPGDVIILYAVGCGPTSPASPPGQQATGLASLTRPVEVTVEGMQAHINYSGIYPPFVGLYRIDIVVPNVPNGDRRIDLSVDGVSTGQSLFLTVGN